MGDVNSPPLLSRRAFLDRVRDAVTQRRGFATGKLGSSEVQRLTYSVVLAREGANSKLLRVLERNLIFHSLTQSALFPPDPAFYLRYNEVYAAHMRNLDVIGFFPDLYTNTLPILDHFHVRAPLIHFLDQEPDRSIPADDENCYLYAFRSKKVLFISSFAEFLCERANRESFENVWSRTGKRWFYPASVAALEFPFGYTASTHAQYPDSLAQLDAITRELDTRDYDVALIAAAGLAIPIASHVKGMGKVGISLGGHLQPLFGISGKRWREMPEYTENYINDHWVSLPERYQLPEKQIADKGAYW